jgi:hypothetical protein
MTSAHQPDPIAASCWSRAARVWLVALTTASAGLLAVAHFGADAQGSLDRQLIWLNLAVAASIVSGCAQVGFLVIGRRAVLRLQRTVLDRRTGAGGPPAARDLEAFAPFETVTVAGTSWAHRPSCPLVAGKQLLPSGRLTACPVCRPAEVAGA